MRQQKLETVTGEIWENALTNSPMGPETLEEKKYFYFAS